MQVREVMTPEVKYINPDITLKEAATQMRQDDIGALPVGENDRLVGMVTDRDIAVRAVADGKDPNAVRVRDAMTPDIVYCFEDDDVRDAANLMKEKQIRRLTILNRDKRLVGICSLGDLAVDCDDLKMCGEVLEKVSQS